MITPGATDALSFRREADSGPSIGASGTTLAMGSHEQELNALLRHVAQGDKLAFKRVYDLIAAKLNGIALRLVRRRDIAEDVLQETFLSIWKNASQYDDAKGAAFTWCAMIVRNKALDRARRMSRRPVEISPDDMTAVQLAIAGCDALTRIDEEGHDVRRCYKALPDNIRDIIGLAFFEGFTHEELADRLCAPLGMIKGRVRKGLVLLKECLSR